MGGRCARVWTQAPRSPKVTRASWFRGTDPPSVADTSGAGVVGKGPSSHAGDGPFAVPDEVYTRLMPVKNDIDPTSRTQRVLAYYRDHPGFHRCKDVGEAIGEPTHPVAVVSRVLYMKGQLERHLVTVPGRGMPITKYGFVNGASPEKTGE